MKEVEFKFHGLFWKQTWIDVVSVTLNVIFVFSQMKLLNLYIKRAQTTTSNSSSSSDISSHSWSHPHHQTLSSTRVSRACLSCKWILLEHTCEYVLFNHILTLELPSPLTWNKHHFICASVRKPTEEHFPSQSVFTLFLLTVCCCVYRRCVRVIRFCWRNKCHCLMFFCLWWVL